MLDAFVGFDVETTGTDPDQDRIIQIGAVRVEGGRPVARWSALVDPGRPVPPFVRRLTGITDEMLAGRPSLDQLLPGFLDFVGACPLVAHNAPFDRGFLAAGLRRAGLRAPLPPAYDSLELARLALPGRAGYRLEEVAAGCGVASGRAHDALADAETAALVFLRLLETLGGYPPESLRTAARFLEAAGSSAAPLVAAAAARAEAGRDTAAPPGRTGGLDAAPPAVAGVAGEPPAASLRRPELPPEAVASWLLPGGAVARRLPGYEARKGQVEMLRAVAATLAEGGALLVEAAGGTGRSLAYLLPALARAAALGEPVLVATRTNRLQEQIRSELERLREALPFPFRAARVKSRSQYFCRLKWEGVLADPGEDPLSLRFFARVALWPARMASGDRADLNVRREEESAWAAVSADDACAGERCRHRRACAFLEACRRAAAAAVVLVDHDLLVADAAAADPLLPPYRRLICDEAHRLPEAASRQFSLRVDEAALGRLLATLKRRGAREVSEAEAAASRLFAALRGVAGGTGGHGPAAPAPARLDAPPAAARDAAAALAAALRRLAGRSPAPDRAVGAAGAEPEPAAAAGPETAVLAAAEAVEAVFLREAAEGEDRQVTWLESEGGEAGNAGPPALRVVRAPVDPGPALARRLFDRLDAVVLTSATLSVGGGFDYFAREAGLPQARTLRVPPPGDGSRRALLCLASDAPDPAASGENAYLEAACGFLFDLGVSLGGRILALFTSQRTLRQVYDRLKDPLEEAGVALLGQGLDGNPARLAEALRASPRTVLLGGAPFWDAEDLPAGAVRCVVVMRLPFRPPGHPLAEARLEAAARRGEDPFLALALPEAVLRFKQAFGRLDRAGPARGAAVVLDPRLLSRRDAYGRTFVESLPGPSLFAGTRREVLAAVRDWVDGGDLRAVRPEINLEENG